MIGRINLKLCPHLILLSRVQPLHNETHSCPCEEKRPVCLCVCVSNLLRGARTRARTLTLQNRRRSSSLMGHRSRHCHARSRHLARSWGTDPTTRTHFMLLARPVRLAPVLPMEAVSIKMRARFFPYQSGGEMSGKSFHSRFFPI